MKTDEDLQKDVMDELKWQPSLNASEIGVAVKSGVVTLSGTVDVYSKKVIAENAVKRVAGVKAVAEDIQVRLSDNAIRNDAEIAEAVCQALKWHSAMDENKIRVVVEDGWVRLEGFVEWEYQKNAARLVVENLVGVRGISNNIEIRPTIEPSDIKRKISAAFHRNATLDSNNVNVIVSGGKVILTGTVKSLAEKRDAGNMAWLSPGVDSVENKIEVDSEVLV